MATVARGVRPGAGQGLRLTGLQPAEPSVLPSTQGHGGWRRQGEAGKPSLKAPERAGQTDQDTAWCATEPPGPGCTPGRA